MSDKNQAIRDVVKGASVVSVGLILELLIAFLAQVVAARYLSAADFGGLTAGTALLDIGAIVAGLGLASGLTRYLPRVATGEKRMLTLATLTISIVTSTLLGLGVALNAEFIAATIFGNPNITVSIRIFGAAIPFAAVLNLAVGGIRGQEVSIYRVLIKNIVHPIARIALVIGAVLYGADQAGLAGAYAFPYVVSAFLGLLLLHRALPSNRASFNRDQIEEVTRYSIPFIIGGISGFIYRSIDIFLILYFLDDAATGVYGVAYAAVSFMGMFSTAVNFLGSPIASRLESEGAVDEAMEMFQAVAHWLLVASVCTLIPLGVFATDFIGIIYGSKYTAGGPVLTVLAVGFAMKNILSLHGPILEAVGHSKTLSFNSTVAAIANLLLNLALIPRVGIVGAAVATTLSFLLRDGLAAAQVYFVLDTTPLSWRATRSITLAVPFLFVVSTVVAPATPGTFLWLLGMTSLISLIYLTAAVIIFGLTETDVMIIRSAEEQYGLPLGRLDWLIRRLANQ